jgi:hypothetical protein
MIELNKVYQHRKGSYYKPIMIASHHDHELNGSKDYDVVIYYRCDLNGVLSSIRGENSEINARQPFYSDLERWNRNFKLIN